MALELFWNWTAIGLTLLLSFTGALALILTGRFGGRRARGIGIDRHVEALLIVSFAVTLSTGGLGQMPVWAGETGIIAVSLLGAIVPVLLAFYFLLAAGPLRALASIPVVAIVSVAAWATSEPVPGLGIIATPPGYYLPAFLAAAGALAVGRLGLVAIPLAYAYGSLGALIGADLLRWEWLFGTPLTAASIGGADGQDLVFLMGLWSAALAGVANASRLVSFERDGNAWSGVADLAIQGRAPEAIEEALQEAHGAMHRWAARNGLAHLSDDVLATLSAGRPVLEQVDALRAAPQPWQPRAVRRALENLEGLTRRLEAPVPRNVAPRERRVLAGAVDLVPVLLLVIAALWATAGLTLAPMPGETTAQTGTRTLLARLILAVWVAMTAHVIVPLITEWATGGRSLGKALFGLQVRRLDGDPPTGWDHIVRNVARLLDVLAFYLIPFVARSANGRQRLGDHFADTYVMSTRIDDVRITTDITAPAAAPATATLPIQDDTRAPW